MREALKAPFPWFGGKSRAAELIWDRFGDPQNYVEPFAGSLAVLLRRPTAAVTETVNDKDCYVANFWRALSTAPDQVAAAASWPVNEADLHSRHLWLVHQAEFRERMKTEPEYFDVRIAGWWVWGISQWIGGGWCSKLGAEPGKTRPALSGKGMGVVSPRLARSIPNIGGTGQGIHGKTEMLAWFEALRNRLRNVRVCCGEWHRILGPSPTVGLGTTAILLDPPYSAEARRDPNLYGVEDLNVAHEVRQWAIEHGDHPDLRIALCGYEGEHALPDGWECVEWKANGGYGNQGQGAGRANSRRERVWFSPHCLRPMSLFAGF
jgi:DNA adenine methylase